MYIFINLKAFLQWHIKILSVFNFSFAFYGKPAWVVKNKRQKKWVASQKNLRPLPGATIRGLREFAVSRCASYKNQWSDGRFLNHTGSTFVGVCRVQCFPPDTVQGIPKILQVPE